MLLYFKDKKIKKMQLHLELYFKGGKITEGIKTHSEICKISNCTVQEKIIIKIHEKKWNDTLELNQLHIFTERDKP